MRVLVVTRMVAPAATEADGHRTQGRRPRPRLFAEQARPLFQIHTTKSPTVVSHACSDDRKRIPRLMWAPYQEDKKKPQAMPYAGRKCGPFNLLSTVIGGAAPDGLERRYRLHPTGSVMRTS